MSAMRLSRFLARAGVASRRGAVDLLDAGRVLVNGKPPTGPGDPIDLLSDRVTLDGRPLAVAAPSWLALNKPSAYVTSRAATERHASVFTLLPDAPAAMVAVGRLDVYSEGLLLCTTDGDAAHRLMHPRWQVPRVYRVDVVGRLEPGARSALDRGVRLPAEKDEESGGTVRPSWWQWRPEGARGELLLELREGRSRVVRRLCTALGLGVRRLVRTAYGPIELGALEPGRSRSLKPRELHDLYGAIHLPVPPM